MYFVNKSNKDYKFIAEKVSLYSSLERNGP